MILNALCIFFSPYILNNTLNVLKVKFLYIYIDIDIYIKKTTDLELKVSC